MLFQFFSLQKQIFRIFLQKEFQPIVSWFDVDGWGKQFIIKLCEGETGSVFNLAKKRPQYSLTGKIGGGGEELSCVKID